MLSEINIINKKNILFNGLKHHIESVRQLIEVATPDSLPSNLVKIGGSQMDFYKGRLTQNQIFDEIILLLRGVAVITPSDFRGWINAATGFRILTLSDNSSWILRLSDNLQQYIHLHPARYSPETMRVKAGTLKTCIALAVLDREQRHVTDLFFFNQIRVDYLGLSPIKNKDDMNLLKLLLKEIMFN